MTEMPLNYKVELEDTYGKHWKTNIQKNKYYLVSMNTWTVCHSPKINRADVNSSWQFLNNTSLLCNWLISFSHKPAQMHNGLSDITWTVQAPTQSGQSCGWTVQAPTQSRIVRRHTSTASANQPPMIWLINSLGVWRKARSCGDRPVFPCPYMWVSIERERCLIISVV